MKTFSWHWRMNLQHAVQQSLDISLARLQINKPEGTCGLIPTLAYFNIVPARMIRTKSQIKVFICICGCWNLETLSLYLRQLRVFVLFCCTKNRIIISFLCVWIIRVRKLPFFPEKGGVWINRVYELLEIIQYSIECSLPTLDSKWCTKKRV